MGLIERVDESNILNWVVLILPQMDPYKKGAFRIDITYPPEYPFKPPKITFKTKTDQVLQALVTLIHEPEPEHPLRGDLAEEYSKDRKKFNKSAEEYTKKHAERRPDS